MAENRPVILTNADRPCSNCRARPCTAEDWLCASCREELESAWRRVAAPSGPPRPAPRGAPGRREPIRPTRHLL